MRWKGSDERVVGKWRREESDGIMGDRTLKELAAVHPLTLLTE